MDIKITIKDKAYRLSFGDSIGSQSVYLISAEKLWLDNEGQVVYGKLYPILMRRKWRKYFKLNKG